MSVPASKVEETLAAVTERLEDAGIEPTVGPSRIRHAEKLQEEEGSVKVERAAGVPEYEAATDFSDKSMGLSKELLHGIQDYGWVKPAKVQAQTVPVIFGTQSNLLVQSKAGTGKTGCFVLGMLGTVDASKPWTQAICLSPVRELANQTTRVTQSLGKYRPDIKVQCIIGGDRGHKYSGKIKAHIIIATPGKLVALVKSKQVKLTNCKLMCIDEADVMVAKFRTALRKIFESMKSPRMFMFSATYESLADPESMALCTKLLDVERKGAPTRIILPLSLTTLDLFSMKADNEADKFDALMHVFASHPCQCIVFCQTRARANWLTKKIREDPDCGFTVGVITGGKMTQKQREEVLKQFRLGTLQILVGTNVLARGIDVPAVKMVINFDLPGRDGEFEVLDSATFMHRIGRTARFGRRGVAIMIHHDAQSKGLVEQMSKVSEKVITPLDDEDEGVCGEQLTESLSRPTAKSDTHARATGAGAGAAAAGAGAGAGQPAARV